MATLSHPGEKGRNGGDELLYAQWIIHNPKKKNHGTSYHKQHTGESN